jgi:hypothetical protein
MKKNEPPGSNHKAPRLTPELTKFVEGMGMYFETSGVPRIGGRILGLLMVAHGPLSAESLASTLKVSRGSVSTNFRLLIASGLIEKVSLPGDRTTYFVFSATAWEKAMKVEMEGAASLKKLAQQGLALLPSGDTTRNHLEGMIKYCDLVTELYQKGLTRWRTLWPSRVR